MSDVRVITDRAAFRRAAEGAPPGARVPVEARLAVADPFEAYRRARDGEGAGAADAVYFETTGGQDGWGYFAVDPVSRLRVGPDLDSEADVPTLAELRTLLDGETLVRGECDVPYPCGAFGWLSYDIAREIEDLPDTTVDDRGLPRLQLAVYDAVAAWREPREGETTLRITACPRIPGEGEDRTADDPVAAAYDRGLARARDLARRATAGDPGVGPPPATDAGRSTSAGTGTGAGAGAGAGAGTGAGAGIDADRAAFTAEVNRETFADRVRRVKRYVRDGDTFQANISQRLCAPATVHPVEAFAALRRVNPAPYSALVEFPGVDLVSASPELLLSVDGDDLLTEPIAGTRPRGETAAEDAALERDLTADEKERAEHAMLVDLERNDLGKVSRYGSVEVSEYRRVDRYSEVMHLVSVVAGRLRADRDLVDAVAAVFPGGTITGAPKPRTMEIIDEVEGTRRGPYTGSIGVFGFDDRATLNIVIRTLTRHADSYYLRVGAGIVHDSVPDHEYEETLDKGRALVTAIDEALETDLAVELRGDD